MLKSILEARLERFEEELDNLTNPRKFKMVTYGLTPEEQEKQDLAEIAKLEKRILTIKKELKTIEENSIEVTKEEIKRIEQKLGE